MKKRGRPSRKAGAGRINCWLPAATYSALRTDAKHKGYTFPNGNIRMIAYLCAVIGEVAAGRAVVPEYDDTQKINSQNS